MALPTRVGGLKVRARSNPTIDPARHRGDDHEQTSIRTGARPGQSSTTAHTGGMATTIPRISVDREKGYFVTKPPMIGLGDARRSPS